MINIHINPFPFCFPQCETTLCYNALADRAEIMYIEPVPCKLKGKGSMEHYRSLLQTTQNTRDLGGYHTLSGSFTRTGVLLRSDVQNYPSADDCRFLKEQGITTIIDMRSVKDTQRKPSGFAAKEGFTYFNFPIDEGSGIPESVDEVPRSYMRIANAKEMVHIFRCIANAKTGVMFNCTAGKDRTGVVSAILLMHAEVGTADIIQDYVLTREYGRERLALVHQNFPEIDMNIVTPCEAFMSEFLRLFTEQYGDTARYFNHLGLSAEEIALLRSKLV